MRSRPWWGVFTLSIVYLFWRAGRGREWVTGISLLILNITSWYDIFCLSFTSNKYNVQEEIDDTKGVIRIRKSKYRQHNGQKKKYRQHNGQKKKYRQHNGLKKKYRQHNGQKKKYRQHMA